MNEGGTWKVRLFGLVIAVACLWLAFGFVTGMPIMFMSMGLAAMVAGPVILFTQGWLGVWLLTLAGMGGLWWLLSFMSGPSSAADILLLWLVMVGLTGLGVAVVPPHVAARHKHAWPFGYLNPQKNAAKAKRDRLLLEEEIVYDVVDDRFDDRWNDDDDDDDELPLPALRKRSGAR